ncbi:Ataxin-3, partial [Galemys pyrenaicus]
KLPGNMDLFLSVQLIRNVLKVWGLELILFNSLKYQMLRIDPINERSFICNYKEHQLTVRKLRKTMVQWEFSLDGSKTNISYITHNFLGSITTRWLFYRVLALSHEESDKEDKATDLHGAIKLSMQDNLRKTSQDTPQTSRTSYFREVMEERTAYFENSSNEIYHDRFHIHVKGQPQVL